MVNRYTDRLIHRAMSSFAALILFFVLLAIAFTYPEDEALGLAFCLSIFWIAGAVWTAFGNAIRRSALFSCLLLTLTVGRFLWIVLPGNWILLILPLLSGFAFLSYRLISNLLNRIAQSIERNHQPVLPRIQDRPMQPELEARRVPHQDIPEPWQSPWDWQLVLAQLQAEGSVEAARLLAETFVDHHLNPQLRITILAAFDQLDQRTHQAAINEICTVWAVTRRYELAKLLLRKKWRASTPPATLILSALLLGEVEFLRTCKPGWIALLVQATVDKDPLIAQRADQVLQNLQSAGYLPEDEKERALFLFMTNQWERYASHDFDRRLLHLTYLNSSKSLQQRIRKKIHTAGRSDFLPIIAGTGLEQGAPVFNAEESELIVQTLIENRNWITLWSRAFDMHFQWSVHAIDALAHNGWKPVNSEEQALFAELTVLVAEGQLMDLSECNDLFSLPIKQATLHVPGEIKGVCFAPDRPILAIGTGEGKVILWNYQTAQRERVLSGFEHPIGKVVFTSERTLLCAELAPLLVPSSIYVFPDVWKDDTHFCLGTHRGSVTALATVNVSQILSTGGDGDVVLWDIAAQKEIRRCKVTPSAEALHISPDGTQLLVVHDGLDLLSLPELRQTNRMGRTAGYQCAAFAPDGQSVFAGGTSGDLFVYQQSQLQGDLLIAKQEPVAEYGPMERVKAVEVLKRTAVVISGSTGGQIRFFSLEGYHPLVSFTVPGGGLTSLNISPTEFILAAGSAEETLTLWNINVLVLHQILKRPFAQIDPMMISTMNTMLGDTSLPLRARQVLQFAQIILRHRLRYAIEIEEAPSIAVGEFDIEVD